MKYFVRKEKIKVLHSKELSEFTVRELQEILEITETEAKKLYNRVQFKKRMREEGNNKNEND